MNMAARDIWWNHISGPQRFINELFNTLMQGFSAILPDSPYVAWPSSLYDLCRQRLETNTEFEMRLLDAGTCEGDPGEFIVTAYSPRQLADYLRAREPGSFIKELLPKTVLWVTRVPDWDAWLKFMSDFRGTFDNTLFVLEADGEGRKLKRCKYIRYTDFISPYDLGLFATMLLSDTDAPAAAKQYVSNVAARLCRADAERLDAFIQSVDFTLIDPMAVWNALPDAIPGALPNAITDATPGPQHGLEKWIWEAQLYSAFPLIEMERIALIGKWHARIDEALALHTILQYGEVVKAPDEVELGTLSYMMTAQDAEGKPILTLPDETDRRRIIFLRDLRNELAHAKTAAPGDITRLLSNEF